MAIIAAVRPVGTQTALGKAVSYMAADHDGAYRLRNATATDDAVLDLFLCLRVLRIAKLTPLISLYVEVLTMCNDAGVLS